PHFPRGMVPGDGQHVIWPAIVGRNRARYLLLTGKKLSAREALEWGAVNEVLPRDRLLGRAWELARELAKRPPLVLRYTRMLFTHGLKRALLDELAMASPARCTRSASSSRLAGEWRRSIAPGTRSPGRTDRQRQAGGRRKAMCKVLAPEDFIRDLLARIEGRRTFGNHPLWRELAEGKLSREQLQVFAVQFFLQVREFPRGVSAMHANCPFPEERMKLAESIYEEETGRLSGCNQPHPEIFIRFGEAIGLTRAAMVEGCALPATRALIDWFELSTKQRSFIEASAAMNRAAEGQAPGASGPMARRLQENYGLSRDAVAFWDIHEVADAEHSEVGDSIVVRHATDAATQARVRDALQHSLDAWWQFFD